MTVSVTGMPATKTILTFAFIFFASITLFIPRFPPAPLMQKYSEISQTTLFIFGVSVSTLLNGIINGLFWTIFAAVTYGLAQLALPTRIPGPLPPMNVARHLAMPRLENSLVESNLNLIPPTFTIPPARKSASTRKKQNKPPARKATHSTSEFEKWRTEWDLNPRHPA